MDTLILDSISSSIKFIASKSAKILEKGGIVIFPTETVYGIGANAYDLDAVKKIYEIKGRKKDNPLIFHVANLNMLEEVAVVSGNIIKIVNEFMPGPLTLVLKSKIPKKYTFGLDTVAVRMPDNLIALKMIEHLSKPVVAPSANISGKPSATDFSHVFDDFNGKVDAIIDGGFTVYGIESTVIDVTSQPFLLLRAGAVSLEDLQNKGVILSFPNKLEALKRSPGTRYKHYAPNALVVPFESKEELAEKIKSLNDKKSALIAVNLYRRHFDKIIVFKDLNEYARLLYATFRYLDALKIDVIFAELPENKGIGLAVRDRIIRASQD